MAITLDWRSLFSSGAFTRAQVELLKNLFEGYDSQLAYTIVNQSTATYNAAQTSGQVIILCDCTANNITINLPTAVGNTATFDIKKTDATANTVTVDPAAAETIDGGATAVILTQYASVESVSDNANWRII